MALQKIQTEDLEQEQEIINKLCAYSNEMKSCVFNSGAGSGKTYALVECLKYIIIHNRENLKKHNQKIACITYTNVAANNIKQKIGATDVAEISTIHERIWQVIKDQKKALLALHKEKLESEIKKIVQFLDENEIYNRLSDEDKKSFIDRMIENKDTYNQIYNLGSKEFRERMKEIIGDSALLNNVSKFKEIVNKLFRKKRYEKCLSKIKEGEYKTVRYDAMYNDDRLDIMRISHDTLLEYGYNMVEKYPLMCRIIIDTYPYILIDEYQDTSEKVVKIMNTLQEYSKKIKHPVFIAYFGDSVQNIYQDGVGAKLKELHFGLEEVKKEYNRRSYKEVIEVANKIRNDGIVQKSIYQDCEGAVVEFYQGTKEQIDDFIDRKAKEWQITLNNPLHCLFSTNEQVAKYSEFYPLYDTMKSAKIYKGSNYNQINTELLSHDTIRLGSMALLLYRLMSLLCKIKNSKTGIDDILMPDERRISLKQLREIVECLQNVKGKTLEEIIKELIEIHNTTSVDSLRSIIKRIFDVETSGELIFETIKRQFIMMLSSRYTINKNEDDEDEDSDIIDTTNKLLGIEISVLEKWYYYICNNDEKERYYHTFHSTKGLEYKNVLVVLEAGFGRNKKFFESFLKGEVDEKNYEEAKNLLYVVVTRAIQNLTILYIDDVKDIQNQVEAIFGEIKKFSKR